MVLWSILKYVFFLLFFTGFISTVYMVYMCTHDKEQETWLFISDHFYLIPGVKPVYCKSPMITSCIRIRMTVVPCFRFRFSAILTVHTISHASILLRMISCSIMASHICFSGFCCEWKKWFVVRKVAKKHFFFLPIFSSSLTLTLVPNVWPNYVCVSIHFFLNT